MKRIRLSALVVAAIAAVTLTGCVAPGPYYSDGYAQQPYYVDPGPVGVAPAVVGIGVYGGGYYGGRGYYGPPPPRYYGPRPGYPYAGAAPRPPGYGPGYGGRPH